jgi:hypothetical protein
MALWQFTVIAVLMGALLVHTSFLTLRVGRASAALKRIEAALLAKGEVVTPAPVAPPVEPTPPLELTDMEDSAARYLTIRDLKVRSEQQRAEATAGALSARRSGSTATPDMSGKFASLLFGREKSENAVLVGSAPVSLEGSDAPDISTEAPTNSGTPTRTETPSFPTSQPDNGNSASVENEDAVTLSSESLIALSLETRALSESIEALSTSIEPPPHPSHAEGGNFAAGEDENAAAVSSESPVALSAESPDAPSASTEPPPSPDSASATVNDDTVEQREREALLFQSNQRRRRRARQGY